MAGRSAMDLSTRIGRLEAAEVRAKALPRSTILGARPMAEMLSVHWNQLREWCDEIPALEKVEAFKRGGAALAWEFNPRKTVAALLKHFRGQSERQAKKSRDISKAIGVRLPEGEAAPSLSETKDLVNLTLTVVAATEKQHRYVLAEAVVSFVEGYNDMVVNGILGVRTKVDPNGNLAPAIRADVDNYLRLVATEVHAEAQQFIEEHRAGFEQGGIG